MKTINKKNNADILSIGHICGKNMKEYRTPCRYKPHLMAERPVGEVRGKPGHVVELKPRRVPLPCV